jgi:hypothetical protein
VTYTRDDLVEWWEERAAGLEHGFTLITPPPGDGMLVLDIVIQGAEAIVHQGDGRAATLSRPGYPSLQYAGLAAWDEGGRSLLAWMEGTNDGLRIVVDDTSAVGVVTVDPLLRSGWLAEAEAHFSDASFGHSVSLAGDVNGDGFNDVVIGAPHLRQPYPAESGRAYVYHGAADGLEPSWAWKASTDDDESHFGVSVSSAGDVNGDGYADVIVGADGYDIGEGRAFVFHGAATGLDSVAAWVSDDQDHGLQRSVGFSVSTAGDVNGDGYGDIVIGGDQNDLGEPSAWFYLGSDSGIQPVAAWTMSFDQIVAFNTVSDAGDVNGDGYADVVLGVPLYDDDSGVDSGQAHLFLGSEGGLDLAAAWTTHGEEEGDRYGGAVSWAGDVNADGYDDVVLGAPLAASDGRAYLFLGSSTGLLSSEAWVAEGVDSGVFDGQFGTALASAGDVNGDGYGDVIIGEPQYDFDEQPNRSGLEGRAHVYLGSVAGLEPDSAWAESYDHGPERLGASVASAGDVNGDGFGDVLVGAPQHDDDGRVYLFLGSCDGGGVDSDGDLVGDNCDVCPGFDDRLDGDLDGLPVGCDICPFVADPGQEDADGDGIGDACVPITLTVRSVSVAEGLTVEVDDAQPGDKVAVFLASGAPEAGPCVAKHAGLCLDVGGREGRQRFGVVADQDGHAALVGVPLPGAALPGDVVTIQAAADRGMGGVKSEPIETTVVP